MIVKLVLLAHVVLALACVDAATPTSSEHRHYSDKRIHTPELSADHPVERPSQHVDDLLPIPVKDIFEFTASQYQKIYSTWWNSPKRDGFPDVGHSSDKEWITTSIHKISFVSAFFPGSLWLLHQYFDQQGGQSPNPISKPTAQFDWLNAAQQTTWALAPLRNQTGTHDIGFEFLGSFVKGLEVSGNKSYIPIINEAASTLALRYSPIVGCTRSWDSDEGFLVIIDNMMNIDLLFTAARLSNNRTLYDMAFSHANRTMHEHFRPSNHSTYHVVEYDESDGSVIKKMTNQGFADWSTWTRGQAWSIHGFTTTYRHTQHEPFLNTAIAAADLFIQQTFSQDRVHPTPYWDFNAPHGNEKQRVYQPKDASAAAIAASGILELSTFVKDPSVSARLFNASVGLLTSLIDQHFNMNNRFGPLPGLLNNCTQGPYHANDQSHPYDVFFFYGEYYFLEALTRLIHIQKDSKR